MRTKVEEDWDSGGGSNPTGLGAKIRRKRKRKGKNEGEMDTPPRSNHRWSRSPSPRGEEQRRSPKIVLKWGVGFRRVSLSFFLEVSFLDEC